MKRPLAYYGAAVLRQKAPPVEAVTPEIRQLVADLIDSVDVDESVGVGLAAPQIHVSLRVFIIRLVDDGPDGQLIYHPATVYINPVLSDPSPETEELSEGCLSIPELSAPVRRPLAVTVEAMDLEGNRFTRRLEGYEARVAMHENDHINGVLYIDRVSEQEKRRLKTPLRELRQKTQKEGL